MALDDHEQKILAEIERQFYEEDPELARAVRQIARPSRFGVRLSLLGVVAGLVIVIGFFATSTLVAFVGFALLVGSAAALVSGLRARGWRSREKKQEGEDPESGWRDPFRRD
ncbi:MAG: DUF3040 domain-containing protein [Acidimicrobiia bacterium]|jgi:Protein of unknown function (DUF3040)